MKQRTKRQQKNKLNKNLFFEKINKIDKYMARLTKGKKRKQANKIRNEKEEVTVDTTEIQNIIQEYYARLYATNFNNLQEVDKFLEYLSFLD